jgi:hypothetical protein
MKNSVYKQSICISLALHEIQARVLHKTFINTTFWNCFWHNSIQLLHKTFIRRQNQFHTIISQNIYYQFTTDDKQNVKFIRGSKLPVEESNQVTTSYHPAKRSSHSSAEEHHILDIFHDLGEPAECRRATGGPSAAVWSCICTVSLVVVSRAERRQVSIVYRRNFGEEEPEFVKLIKVCLLPWI